MPDLTSLIQIINTGGLVGVLTILAFPNLRSKFGFDRNRVDDSDRLADAMKKAFIEDEHSPILVKGRIQRICDTVEKMQEDIAIIKKAIMKV